MSSCSCVREIIKYFRKWSYLKKKGDNLSMLFLMESCIPLLHGWFSFHDVLFIAYFLALEQCCKKYSQLIKLSWRCVKWQNTNTNSVICYVQLAKCIYTITAISCRWYWSCLKLLLAFLCGEKYCWLGHSDHSYFKLM